MGPELIITAGPSGVVIPTGAQPATWRPLPAALAARGRSRRGGPRGDRHRARSDVGGVPSSPWEPEQKIPHTSAGKGRPPRTLRGPPPVSTSSPSRSRSSAHSDSDGAVVRALPVSKNLIAASASFFDSTVAQIENSLASESDENVPEVWEPRRERRTCVTCDTRWHRPANDMGNGTLMERPLAPPAPGVRFGHAAAISHASPTKMIGSFAL